MFDLYVLQNRQLILTYGAGLVLMLALFLSYLPMKRPRDPETFQQDTSPQPRTWRQVWSYIPWVLILVYAWTVVYSVVDMIWKSKHPPNY